MVKTEKPELVGYIIKGLDKAILEKYLYRLSIRDLNDFVRELREKKSV